MMVHLHMLSFIKDSLFLSFKVEFGKLSVLETMFSELYLKRWQRAGLSKIAKYSEE